MEQVVVSGVAGGKKKRLIDHYRSAPFLGHLLVFKLA